jgi:hypothetical protein
VDEHDLTVFIAFVFVVASSMLLVLRCAGPG